MTSLNSLSGLNTATTHTVGNQAAREFGWNAYTDDTLLVRMTEKFAPWAAEQAAELGQFAGDEYMQNQARLANRHGPELKTHDRYGNRIDWVEFHPAWHEVMSLSVRFGVHSLAWIAKETGKSNGHFARAVMSYIWNQIEVGSACPLGMTYAAYPALSAPHFRGWQEKVISPDYDPRPLPIDQKTGAIIGWGMTEKQAGSDLRQLQTTARFVEDSANGPVYAIRGHKWFFSAPQVDAFFTLARTESGVSLFFCPGFLPDGSRNHIRLQRLKDKAGNRSNASSEVEFHDTLGWLVGEEGHGVREILSNTHLTRLDLAIGSAGMMRQALTLALNHTQSREAFGSPISQLPMMNNILADLAIEVEAATLLALRAARAVDEMETGTDQQKLAARPMTPLAKYWICKRAPAVVTEALECQGGNGFIEENPMARLYREVPLNQIWEGTSNMMCMDILRGQRQSPEMADALMADMEDVRGYDAKLDRWVQEMGDELVRPYNDDGHGRRLAGLMANAVQAAELARYGSKGSFEAFCHSRLNGDWGYVFGTLAPSPELSGIVDQATVIRRPAG